MACLSISRGVVSIFRGIPELHLIRKIMSPSEYSTNYKRCCEYILSGSDNAPQSQRRKCCHKRSTKSVQFSPSVNLRCFYQSGPKQPQDAATASSSLSLWLDKDEFDSIKRRARSLSKLHCRIHSKNNSQAAGNISSTSSPPFASTNTTAKTTNIGDAVRYEIEGESLRGMEYITNICNGKKRRQIKDDAIHAVLIWQQGQLVSTSFDNDVVVYAVESALEVDDNKLAKLYRAKTQEALAYARRVAEEDAKVATSILAEELHEYLC